MPNPPKIKDEDTSYNLFRENNRSVDRVEIKLDRLLEINKSQVEDLKGVKEDISELKDEVASISSEFKLHAFQDATRFSDWETKFSKEIEPILKHVNEKIALGGWIRTNQKLIIFFVLTILTALGIIKSDQLMSYVSSNHMTESTKEAPKELPEEPKTKLHNDIEKAFDNNQKKDN